jgi:hypothetical protein
MCSLWGTDKPVELGWVYIKRPVQHLLNKNWTNPLPEGLASTAWEPSKLPNYVSVKPPLQTVVSLTTPPPNFLLSLSLSLYKKTGRWIMSRIVIVILIYCRHKPVDLVKHFIAVLDGSRIRRCVYLSSNACEVVHLFVCLFVWTNDAVRIRCARCRDCRNVEARVGVPLNWSLLQIIGARAGQQKCLLSTWRCKKPRDGLICGLHGDCVNGPEHIASLLLLLLSEIGELNWVLIEKSRKYL